MVIFGDYASYLQVRGFSSEHIYRTQLKLKMFADWAEIRGILDLKEINYAVIEAYQRYLFHYHSEKTQKRLNSKTQRSRLSCLKVFFSLDGQD